MKDKRIIRIKDPRLRKIRNEFRNLWFIHYESIYKRLSTEMRRLRFDGEGKLLGPDEMKDADVLNIYHSLQRSQQDLREDFKRSICMCYTCGRIDLDMYYNRPYRSWFCVECVPVILTGYANIQIKKELDTYYCDDDNDDFGESFF